MPRVPAPEEERIATAGDWITLIGERGRISGASCLLGHTRVATSVRIGEELDAISSRVSKFGSTVDQSRLKFAVRKRGKNRVKQGMKADVHAGVSEGPNAFGFQLRASSRI